MPVIRVFVLLFIACFFRFFAYSQQLISGKVTDIVTKEGIPFATIKASKGIHGTIAALDGTFELRIFPGEGVNAITISATGYKQTTMALPLSTNVIYLQPANNTLEEVTIRPPMEKIRRILNKAIAAKKDNNPDKYEHYQCHAYYKMITDIGLPDSVKNDTSAKRRKIASFAENQHLLLSETYSIRSWKKPQQLQEDVLATRISGLQHAAFTGMVTDVLPFHAYNDYITLNGKDFHSPLSRGYEQNYRLNLSDEIMDGTDTIWVISFRPKGINGNNLSGRVYIHSDGYAISQLIAMANDTLLKQKVRVEQQYERVPWQGSSNRWFPARLNYIVEREMKSGTTPYTLLMKGNSQIDSVRWDIPTAFRFDKRHTVRMADGASNRTDNELNNLRPLPLDQKELRTYHVIDSIGKEVKADKIISHMRHIPEGRVSLSIFDIDFTRLLSYNQYENIRLGLGMQTNEKLIKWLSVGGWGGYGFGDKKWKYGAFAEVYADKYHEFIFRAAYTDDISDPGRITMNKTLDKNYLRMFLLQRADNIKSTCLSVKKKIAWWDAEISARQQEIIPRYNYALNIDGTQYKTFTAQEASLNLRYAFAERTAPFFSSYYSMGSRYPVLYGKLTAGKVEAGTMQNQYIQAIAAITWQKHINRLGNERFMTEAGKSWSDNTLPLSKLFAGNGFKYDAQSFVSLYAFGGLMTMYPYEYYTDQFVQAIWRHDFDWKLYKLEAAKSQLSSAPNIGLQYNVLYGYLADKAAHENISIAVPDNGYHEAGLLLNNLIRMRSGNMYYYSINVGYFYHITSSFDAGKNGKFVIGASVEF